MNREQLNRAALDAASRCMTKKKFIALVDVFLEMAKLTPGDHNEWRLGKVPYLEKVIRLNLSQINEVCRAVHASARAGKLKPSWTAYVKWGKGGRPPLRFTKSGNAELERHWATHYLHPKLGSESPATASSQPSGDDTSEGIL